MDIAITSNAKALAHAMGDFSGKQIPFATARALTDVAFMAQRKEKGDLGKHLHLRNRFSAGGIQVNPAEKGDWPHAYAEVGIDEKRSYLVDHVLGGKREGGTHGRAILEDESLRSGSGRVPAGKRPKALIERARRAARQAQLTGAFGGKAKAKVGGIVVIDSAKWGGELVLQRMAAGKDGLKLLYAFRKGVTIKREVPFEQTAEQVVAREYRGAFYRRLEQAIG